jgi:hypothetical protein
MHYNAQHTKLVTNFPCNIGFYFKITKKHTSQCTQIYNALLRYFYKAHQISLKHLIIKYCFFLFQNN